MFLNWTYMHRNQTPDFFTSLTGRKADLGLHLKCKQCYQDTLCMVLFLEEHENCTYWCVLYSLFKLPLQQVRLKLQILFSSFYPSIIFTLLHCHLLLIYNDSKHVLFLFCDLNMLSWFFSQSYGLLGPSGCGKTTLLKCIVGTLKISRGHITVLGKPPAFPGHAVPGKMVGYMPQVNTSKSLSELELKRTETGGIESL